MYNTSTGRFQTMDTYEGDQQEPQSCHKYTYVEDNPVDNVDPSGHDIGEAMGALGIELSINLTLQSPVVQRALQRAQLMAMGHISSKTFWDAYKLVNYDTFPPEKNVEVWKTVGGNIGKQFGPVAENSCATRVSWGLNYGGGPIPVGTPGAWHNFSDQSYNNKRGDDKYYIINAGQMNAYLTGKWGKPDFSQVGTVTQLNSIIAGLQEGQCAIFATRQSPGHSGVLKKGYKDPYVEGELPLDVWELLVP
jgi:hypothetical protein